MIGFMLSVWGFINNYGKPLLDFVKIRWQLIGSILLAITIGLSFYFLLSRNSKIDKQFNAQHEIIEILRAQYQRDSLKNVAEKMKMQLINDSLQHVIQQKNEKDSLNNNRNLSELDAIRAINRSFKNR